MNTENREYEFDAIIKYVDAMNGYKAHKAVCELSTENVIAIFGPFSPKTIGITASMCAIMGIPHFTAVWQPEPMDAYERPARNMTINLYPDSSLLAKAYADFLIDSGWKGYNVVYEDNDGLMRLKDVLQVYRAKSMPVTVQQLESGDDLRHILKKINSTGSPSLDTIFDCKTELIPKFLNYAPMFGMAGDYQRFLFTSLDMHILPLMDNEQMSTTNISALRMLNPSNSDLQSAVHEIIQIGRKYNRFYETSAEQTKLNTALIYDAVKLFNYAFGQVYETNKDNLLPPQFLECAADSGPAWPMGQKVVNEIFEMESFEGITGSMLFSNEGIRVHFALEVLEIYNRKLSSIAIWTPPGELKFLRSKSEIEYLDNESLTGRHIRVVSRLEKPYLAYL